MAITNIQKKTNPVSVHTEFAGTGSVTTTFASGPSQHNFVATVLYGTAVGEAFTAPTTNSTLWSTAKTANTASGGVAIFYKADAAAGEATGVTVGLSPSGSGAMVTYEYSGLLTSAVLDAKGSASNGGTVGSLAITTVENIAQASELILAGVTMDGTIAGSGAVGWTNGVTSDYDALEGGIGSSISTTLTTGATYTTTASWTNLHSPVGAVATFKAAGAGGGGIKIWNGTTWVSKPVKIWNGSSWVTKTVKRWNGSTWVPTSQIKHPVLAPEQAEEFKPNRRGVWEPVRKGLWIPPLRIAA